jgi:hypothetical protein
VSYLNTNGLVKLSVPGILFSMSVAAVRNALALGAPTAALDQRLLRSLIQSPGDLQNPAGTESAGLLPLGIPALDRVLPERGLPTGQIIELSLQSSAIRRQQGRRDGEAAPSGVRNRRADCLGVSIGAGLGTSVGLWACHAAQQQARRHGGRAWCAFVDPSQTLFAPGIAQAGVDLDRLLVVCPPLQSLERVAIKLTEARAFSVIVVDTLSSTAQQGSLSSWTKVVRRLALAVRSTQAVVLLLTDRSVRRATPLPVGMRLELGVTGLRSVRDSSGEPTLLRQLSVKVAKHRHGRTTDEQWIELPSFTPRPASMVLNSTAGPSTAEHSVARTALVRARSPQGAAAQGDRCAS